MAYDLIFGKIRRNWSCGAVLSLTDAQAPGTLEYDLSAKRDALRVGSLARAEIQENINTIVRLDTAKRLPLAVRKEFGGFLKKWYDFNTPRGGKYTPRDFIALVNFREANKRFTERLVIFDQLAKTPLKQPVSPTSLVPLGLPGSLQPLPARPWGWLFGLGLSLAGLGFIAGKGR